MPGDQTNTQTTSGDPANINCMTENHANDNIIDIINDGGVENARKWS